MTVKAKEIVRSIQELEYQERYLTSMIALCMAEANLLDEQIRVYSDSGLSIQIKLKDLRAELKDYE